MAHYQFTLTGKMPLLMHQDDVMSQDLVKEWRNTDAGRKAPNGDDRHPGWLWQTYLYKDDNGFICMPSGNIMPALRAAATQITLKKQKSFKEVAVRAIVIQEEYCSFSAVISNSLQKIKLEPLAQVKDEPFSVQAARAKDLGFLIDVRRATVGAAKHVRCRPRFNRWQVSGSLETTDEALTPEILTRIFELAGQQGLGDWRPSSPKRPGPYGTFEARLQARRG